MLFSVIVPIYNVEEYLDNCIKSVLEQTCGDFELILVDDCSPDRCGEICDEYAKCDNRIKVIHKKNGGLVSARVSGLSVAEGEYVLNLDGDDAIEQNTLESAKKIIDKTNSDIISFNYKKIENGKSTFVMDSGLDEGLYDKEKKEKYILGRVLADENMTHIIYFLAGRIIRRSLLEKHQVNVPESISLGEDISCMTPCFLEAERIYISREENYLYTVRANSMTTDFNINQIEKLWKITSLLESRYGDNEFLEKQIPRYCTYMFFAILADAAERGAFKSIGEIAELLKKTGMEKLFNKAYFSNISIKSKISIFLIKHKKIKTAFYFLNGCKKIKSLVDRR